MSTGTAPLDVRRREAERRLHASRRELQQAVRELRRAARRSVDPRSLLRRHPAVALGVAAALGLWIAKRHGSRRAQRALAPKSRSKNPRTRRIR